jgi:hypothetical protein
MEVLLQWNESREFKDFAAIMPEQKKLNQF